MLSQQLHRQCGCRQQASYVSGSAKAPTPRVPQPHPPAGPSTAANAGLRRRSSHVCAADGDSLGYTNVNGPININTNVNVMLDPLASAGEKAKPPLDRSKGLWTRCDKCGVILYIKHLKEHHHICFGCNYHLKMTSLERVEHLIDPGTWRPLDETLSPVDPLEFTDLKAYPDRVKESQEKTGLQDGVRTGTGLLHGIPVALGVMDFGFMGGSMGSVVGEKLTRLIEYATQEGLCLMIVCTSGGARMQEGILSLMQMAKISAALHVHQNCANLLYIALLTSPTTGGVTASFGMLGDIIIAEPQAIIGFAGRRVIEQTLQEQLPDDFQTAEYLLEHGLLDLVVPRSFLKGALYEIVDFYKDAPFKRSGHIPFGIQRASYLTTEEKVRRKWREWTQPPAGTSNGDGTPPLLAKSTDLAVTKDEPSFQDVVVSFKNLCSTIDNGVDIRDLVKDGTLLNDSIALAKSSEVEWIQRQGALLQNGSSGSSGDDEFVFRVKPAAPTALPLGA